MPEEPRLYSGELTAEAAASAMQAARLSAVDLMDSADVLYALKRFPHSLHLSILAIEEAGKVDILMRLFLGHGDRKKSWVRYRNHRAKTSSLNQAILMRIRSTHPEISLERARELRDLGPTPEELEGSRLRAVYSDCLEASNGFLCHAPRNVDWREQPWSRLCEAQAIVHLIRNITAAELDIWKRHCETTRGSSCSPETFYDAVRRDLLANGFVTEGWWDAFFQDLLESGEDGQGEVVHGR